MFFVNKDFHIGNYCGFALWATPSGALDFGPADRGMKSPSVTRRSNGVLVARPGVDQDMSSRRGVVTAIDPVARTMTVPGPWNGQDIPDRG